MSPRILILINHKEDQLLLRCLGHGFLDLSVRIQVFSEYLLLNVVNGVRIDTIRRLAERVALIGGNR